MNKRDISLLPLTDDQLLVVASIPFFSATDSPHDPWRYLSKTGNRGINAYRRQKGKRQLVREQSAA